jgi:DNA-binding response OmpR family regulator
MPLLIGTPAFHEGIFRVRLAPVQRTPVTLRNMKILVVEDDRKVAGFIEQGLREEGYAVDVAPDGDEGTMLAHVYDYDLLVLDVMLPKKTGLQVAAELRREGRKTPILMLTARDATEDVVRGLDAGADDYLTKPFRFDELLARARALVRRGGASRTEILNYGPIELDRLKHKAKVKNKPLDLTPKEFQLLEHFLLRPEDVVRRTELLEKVWDLHFDPESNVVDVHVGNLRRKLREAAGAELLQTVRGVGFRLQQPGSNGE